MQHHTLQAFGQGIHALEHALHAMAEATARSYDDALVVTRNRDAGLALQLARGDEAIDRQRQAIEDQAIALIARYQPVADDLRRILAVLWMVIDLERVADHAVDIARCAAALDRAASDPQALAFARATGELLHAGVRLVAHPEPATALALHARERGLDRMQLDVEMALFAGLRGGGEAAQSASRFLDMVKRCARVADHVANLCEAVHYRSAGTRLAQERRESERQALRGG